MHMYIFKTNECVHNIEIYKYNIFIYIKYLCISNIRILYISI